MGESIQHLASNTQPSLSVVIVTYDSEEQIRDCLESVAKYAPPATDVYVVDNDSDDNTADVVKTCFPQVHFTQNSENAGFAVANNSVLKHLDSDYVLLLNPDTVLREGCISHLIQESISDPSIGMLGCRLETLDGHLDHAAKRTIPSPIEAIKYFLGKRFSRISSQYTAPNVDALGYGDVDAINGAFMLMRRAAIKEVGLLDEEFWMYGEDLDLCTRYRDAGWRVVYDGRVSALHIKGASSGIRSFHLNYEFHRSMYLYYKKHTDAHILATVPVGMGIYVKFIITALIDSTRRIAHTVRPHSE
ncbi:glycosyltransferase family 2 protein [Acidipropionibacterium jensenii]|uniref:glycosyltransferase family 2 protein n=1 Tax=Acidipropionibacterium jensenii TaxID=1749 RepID=UPI00214AF8AF|nr:glycosyltransferase family 2 protein [Acidipropionibacterium jensenii]